MGEIVGAAIVGHQPTIMVPEPLRRMMGHGRDTTLVEPGIPKLREALDACGANTFVIFDTHWFTTIEHIAAGAASFRGTYTSEELPTLIATTGTTIPAHPSLPRSSPA